MNIYQKYILILFILGSNTAFAQQLRIIEKPIIFDATRTQLSLDYLKRRHSIIQEEPTIKPTMIVLHWTASRSLMGTYNAFNKSILPSDRKNLTGVSKLNVSSHFLVDRDGSIYQLLPDTTFARHVIGLNYCAIGIENVGSNDYPLTKAQLLANEKLVRYLAKKYNIQYLIGHYEHTLFKNTSMWRETNPYYHSDKIDPGKLFMKNIREELQDLNLKGAPIHLGK
ncbi:N-acetylmuramoyl-L-alanine amidase [Pedobacter polaris]|uniref:N-acetylmuramoyl-L-alanine amidase n=1 Tax=Pedobacter polaris TaxID=2571273 RepID=A0A4U1CGN5_9SPHI|nr:peptidoglycan recognition family protein [Pedobacter polaris]TKC05641.1 N-acetylmuramoyl-L-alanine amidase [Pedobacter polaris]